MAEEPRVLVLVRHGQTSWNAIGRAQGHIDVPLDDTGLVQAQGAAPALASLEPALLVSSDLTRARQSMEPLEEITGMACHPDPRLREYDVGIRGGLTQEDFAERYPEEYDAWHRGDESRLVRGAESSAEVAQRVATALDEALAALAPGETGIAMMHGAATKVAVCRLLGWPLEARHGLVGLDNCGWAVLHEHHQAPGLRLLAWNRRAPGNQRRR